MSTHALLRMICIFTLAVFAVSADEQFGDFEIAKADKVVTLTGAYPTELDKIQYSCQASECEPTVYFALPTQYNDKLVSISFARTKDGKNQFNHTSRLYQHDQQNFTLYELDIERSLSEGDSFVLYVQLLFINRYVNFPASIELSEDQKFEYQDTKTFVSPYQVRSSNVAYKFSKLLSYDPDGEKRGLSLVQFSTKDLSPFTTTRHIAHGVNNSPQVLFSEVERIIEVSHWGNIAVVEFYKLKNVGPELKGEFSRVQFSSQNNFEARNAWKGIETTYPYEIWGLYYRDEVGNISTSRAYRDHRSEVVKAAFVPRYALLGGWKVNYEIGYNLNTKGFLHHDGSHFQLTNIPIAYGLNQIQTEKYTVRIILPEGSREVQMSVEGTQINMKNIQVGQNFGYLDFKGRNVYTIPNFKGKYSSETLQVDYQLETSAIWMKPLHIFGAFFSLLILVVTIKRLNMSAFQDEDSKDD